MMASVDEGIGMVFDALEATRQLDRTFILFLGDNGYFFGEHALGPERRFAYEEGIAPRSSCAIRPRPGRRYARMALAIDIAPTIERPGTLGQ
jgi:N-acetylglucosamine-6-sulfatase